MLTSYIVMEKPLSLSPSPSPSLPLSLPPLILFSHLFYGFYSCYNIFYYFFHIKIIILFILHSFSPTLFNHFICWGFLMLYNIYIFLQKYFSNVYVIFLSQYFLFLYNYFFFLRRERVKGTH